MKFEKVIPPSQKPGELAMHDLHFLMADELCELASVCKEVENALGALLEHPNNPRDQPIIALQGLDRLRQSLEDMARLTKVLALPISFTGHETVSPTVIRDNIILAGLADRLTRTPDTDNTEQDSIQDEFWD